MHPRTPTMTSGPYCPTCGEPVGERAVYCMHCGAEFGEDGIGARTDAGLADSYDAVGSADATTDAQPDGDPAVSSGGEPGSGDLLDRLFHPDGLLDNSLTIVIGGVVGLCCGVVALFVFGAVGSGGVGLLAGLVAFVGVTGWLARQYSLFGAVRGGCYALAVALLALPLVALTDAAKGGTLGGQVILFLVAELVFGLIAAPVAGIGYVAGKRRPDAPTGADG
jgi:hypothetical protein